MRMVTQLYLQVPAEMCAFMSTVTVLNTQNMSVYITYRSACLTK